MKQLILLFLLCSAGMTWAQSPAQKGNAQYKNLDYAGAESSYRKALETSPNDTLASFNLGNALHQQKKYNEAAEQFARVARIAQSPLTKSTAYYNQGVSFTRQNNLAASIEAYKNALRLNPADKEARENLQKALAEQKKQQQEAQKKPQPQMKQSEAEQKLRQLQQKEKNLQQKKQQAKTEGAPPAKDW